jgi:thermitase
LVKFKPEYSGRANAIVNGLGGTIEKTLPGLDVHVVKLPQGATVANAVDRLSSLPQVKFAEPNYITYATKVPNDADYSKQWGPKMVGAEKGWDLTTGKSSAVIAIIDSGVDLTHPEFQGRLLAGYDFVDNDNDPKDEFGHGTHCAGIAAGKGNNGIGMAGMSWGSTILPVRVLGASGSGSSDGVAAGIKYAADRGAKVLSLSLGGPGDSQTMHEAVLYAFGKGSVVVGAAGNSNSGEPFYPASYPEVINVGATNSTDAKASFSNWGPTVDVAAPGEGIYSTLPGTYGLQSGTSMACPMVAGLCGLLYSYGKNGLKNTEVRSAIETTCKPMDTTFVQKGRIQVYEALKKVPRGVAVVTMLSGISKHTGGATFGSLSSAQFDDGAFFTVSSTQSGAVGAVAATVLTFKVATPAVNLDSVILNLRQTGALRVTNMIFVLNPDTKLYEPLQSLPMTGLEQANSITLSAPAKYISDAKEIKFLTRGVLPKRLQSPSLSSFSLGVDQATLGITTIN